MDQEELVRIKTAQAAAVADGNTAAAEALGKDLEYANGAVGTEKQARPARKASSARLRGEGKQTR